MKKLLIAISILGLAGVAQAADLDSTAVLKTTKLSERVKGVYFNSGGSEPTNYSLQTWNSQGTSAYESGSTNVNIESNYCSTDKKPCGASWTATMTAYKDYNTSS